MILDENRIFNGIWLITKCDELAYSCLLGVNLRLKSLLSAQIYGFLKISPLITSEIDGSNINPSHWNERKKHYSPYRSYSDLQKEYDGESNIKKIWARKNWYVSNQTWFSSPWVASCCISNFCWQNRTGTM